jgi:hypothetical protein
VLSDLVASFATIEWCKQRVCKFAPRDPQQFLQAVYGAEQIVWRCHPPVAFEIDEGNVFCEGLSLIRAIAETPRWCFGPAVASRVFRQGHNSKSVSPRKRATNQSFQGLSSSNSPKKACGVAD